MIAIHLSCVKLGLTIAGISSWVAVVGVNLRKRFRISRVSNQDELICEESLQTSRSRENLADVNENTDQMHKRSFKVDQSMMENESDIVSGSSLTILKDMLNEKLEEIKTENAKHLSKMRKTIEKNEIEYKETEKRVKKSCKDMQEAITSQRRETRKRFERLEKKPHSR